jgi:protein-S-isoprenylcysteine O-methyltransferase Ste14
MNFLGEASVFLTVGIFTWHRLIVAPWILFCVYWTIGAVRTRRTVKREPFVARYGIVFLEVVGFTLLFDEDAGLGFLGQRVMHRGVGAAEIGIALTWIGILIALWARWHLGQYWSGRVTIKEGHQLIRTGPYARLRHPIYTGLDLAAIGVAVTFDRWRCVVGVCVIVIGFWIKARREERMLGEQFGNAFVEHRRHTGFLLPRLR